MLLSVVLAAVSLLSVVSSSAVLPASIVSRQASANFPGEKLAGYYFVYFLGSGAANENVFTALSHGNNPLLWNKTMNGSPVLTSTAGTKGIRDPFLMRGKNNTYYILSTDELSTNWSVVSRFGSTSITIFESSDLITWTPKGGQVRQIIGNNSGDAWAPRGMYDPIKDNYFIIFSAILYDNAADPNHNDPNAYQIMMYTTTTDFSTFAPAKTWIDRGPNNGTGYATIDTELFRASDGTTLYRFTKNEGARTTANPQGKSVFQEVSPSGDPLGPWYPVVSGLGTPLQVEGPAAFQDNLDPNKVWLFLDQYSGKGYMPYSTNDISKGVFTRYSAYTMPVSVLHHGSVLPVYESEYNRLWAHLILQGTSLGSPISAA